MLQNPPPPDAIDSFATSTKIRILLIEDDENTGLIITDLLSAQGYEVLLAKDGEQGLKRFHETSPQMIISDIMMPRMTGFQLVAKLRECSETLFVPIIFLSALSSPENVRRGMNLGVEDYLSKPISAQDLLECVARNLKKSETLKLAASASYTTLREELATSIPHELLTPLTAVIGFSELLSSEASRMEKEEIIHMADNIKQGAQRLLTKVKDFLSYTELRAALYDPAFKIRKLELSLEAITSVKEAVDAATQTYARQRDVATQLHIRTRLPEPDHARTVVWHLLDNALKFSSPGQAVTLSIAEASGQLMIRVHDHGIGMTEEQCESVGVLRQFNRNQSCKGGLGLGLEIVKSIAALYGGRLLLESKPGQGTLTTFIVPLPDSPSRLA